MEKSKWDANDEHNRCLQDVKNFKKNGGKITQCESRVNKVTKKEVVNLKSEPWAWNRNKK